MYAYRASVSLNAIVHTPIQEAVRSQHVSHTLRLQHLLLTTHFRNLSRPTFITEKPFSDTNKQWIEYESCLWRIWRGRINNCVARFMMPVTCARKKLQMYTRCGWMVTNVFGCDLIHKTSNVLMGYWSRIVDCEFVYLIKMI